MKVNPHKHPFIDLEGIDGCGKSTLIEKIREWDKLHELNSVFTEEPTGKFLPGQKIHGLLKNGLFDDDGRKVPADEFQRLYIFDRLEHRLEEAVFLQKQPIITSRDFPSTVCYGIAQGLSPEWAFPEHERILGDLFFAPDLILILDLSAEEAMERVKLSGKATDHFEKKLDFLKKVREAYLQFPKIMKAVYPDVSLDIRIISALGSPKSVYKKTILPIAEIFREKSYRK